MDLLQKDQERTLLTIDWGNSRGKWALFRNDVLEEHGYTDGQDLIAIVDRMRPEAILACFTGKPLKNALNVQKIIPAYQLVAGSELPFVSLYSTPKTLGPDRIALVLGAMQVYSNSPCLIIDAGTCITLDWINKKGQHAGGSIHPGLNMRLRAMHEFTSALPLLNYTTEEIPALSSLSTRDNMLTGAILGALREIEAFAGDYEQKEAGLKVIITGGDGPYLDKHLKIRKFADPHLLHKGLNALYQLHIRGRIVLPALGH